MSVLGFSRALRTALTKIAQSTTLLRHFSHAATHYFCSASSHSLRIQATLRRTYKRAKRYYTSNQPFVIGAGLLAMSLGCGLWSVFVLGVVYERHYTQKHYMHAHANSAPLDSTHTLESSTQTSSQSDTSALDSASSHAKTHSTPHTPTQTSPTQTLTIGDSLQALRQGKPTIPKPDEKESIITGNLTYANAIAIAKHNLAIQDYARARIWIYRAYTLESGTKEVWDLYWQSVSEDRQTTAQQRQEAYALYIYAKGYFRF